jgi:predicted RNA-binding protein associated with RNAse of E/G family
VDPDRSWRWKDEDHLAEALDVGLFTAQQAKAMRAEGERVIERIEAWAAPFDEGWENWRPDPDWPLPSIPNGWADL